jgi:hypothetical protein
MVIARTEAEICENRSFGHAAPGARCEVCSHTNLVHSISVIGASTPNDECMLCRLEFLNGKLERLVERYETTLAKVDRGPQSTPDPRG